MVVLKILNLLLSFFRGPKDKMRVIASNDGKIQKQSLRQKFVSLQKIVKFRISRQNWITETITNY